MADGTQYSLAWGYRRSIQSGRDVFAKVRSSGEVTLPKETDDEAYIEAGERVVFRVAGASTVELLFRKGNQ